MADCSDEYPDCAANAFDCAGECGGSAVEDDCGVCDDDPLNDNADIDACGDCFGGVADTDGDGICDTEDVEPNCATNDTDDCGVCGGGNADKDCNGDCFGIAVEVTLCEDTDGDGLGNPGSETTECVDGGRDVTDGCDLRI